MPSVILANADLALFSDPNGTRVVLPRVKAQARNRSFQQTVVQFEGDSQPTQFRGVARPRSYGMTARFLSAEHSTMNSLLALFESAFDAADGRLLLRTNAFLVTGLNPIEAIVAADVAETPVGGQAWDVSWTAQTVKFSLAV